MNENYFTYIIEIFFSCSELSVGPLLRCVGYHQPLNLSDEIPPARHSNIKYAPFQEGRDNISFVPSQSL